MKRNLLLKALLMKAQAIFKVAACLLFLATLPDYARAQESQIIGDPLDTYGDIDCELAEARLDNFAVSLSMNPDSKGYIVVYGGRKLPGRTLPHLWWTKDYLSSIRGIDPRRIIIIRGPDKNELEVVLWIAPKGAAPPEIDKPSSVSRDDDLPVKFDEGGMDISFFRGTELYPEAYLCPLRELSFKGFADAVRAKSDSMAYVITYTAFGKGAQRARMVNEHIRNVLVKNRLNAQRIKTVYGGHRETPSVELWIVPKMAALPEPTPTQRKNSDKGIK